MAHADYDCCALCDCKLTYGGERTKESLCEGCLLRLQAEGIPAVTPEQILKWLGSVSVEQRKRRLLELGYSHCHYSNDFDSEIKRLLDEAFTIGVQIENQKDKEA